MVGIVNPITFFQRNSARQNVEGGAIEVFETQLANSSTTFVSGSYNVANTAFDLDVFELPANALVTGIQLYVTQAWDSATAATVSIGDSGSATKYLAATSIKATGITAGSISSEVYPIPSNIRLRFALNGATTATVGKLFVAIQYIVLGREQFNWGSSASTAVLGGFAQTVI